MRNLASKRQTQEVEFGKNPLITLWQILPPKCGKPKTLNLPFGMILATHLKNVGGDLLMSLRYHVDI